LPQAALIFSLTIALLAAWWRISEYSRFAAWYAKKRFVIKMTVRYPRICMQSPGKYYPVLLAYNAHFLFFVLAEQAASLCFAAPGLGVFCATVVSEL